MTAGKEHIRHKQEVCLQQQQQAAAAHSIQHHVAAASTPVPVQEHVPSSYLWRPNGKQEAIGCRHPAATPDLTKTTWSLLLPLPPFPPHHQPPHVSCTPTCSCSAPRQYIQGTATLGPLPPGCAHPDARGSAPSSPPPPDTPLLRPPVLPLQDGGEGGQGPLQGSIWCPCVRQRCNQGSGRGGGSCAAAAVFAAAVVAAP